MLQEDTGATAAGGGAGAGAGGGRRASGLGESPSRRSSASVPLHMRGYGAAVPDMTLSPASPLHSAVSLVLRHRESSGSVDSPTRANLRSSSDAAAPDDGGFHAALVTLMKVCMGTGALALPFAVVQGGLVWSAAGLVLMALWNGYATTRLLECKELLDSGLGTGGEDVEANAVFAFIGAKACGRFGRALVNFCMGVTLTGCAVSYLIAATDLLEATPVSLIFEHHPGLTRLLNSLLCVLVVLPLSVRTFGFLSYTSVVGLISLGLSFLVIIAAGFAAAAAAKSTPAGSTVLVEVTARSFLRQALATTPQGLAQFFGIACFCFGIPPLVFPIQGAMRRPEFFPTAVRWALASVALLYIAVAETIAVLYGFDKDAPSNILEVLPRDSAVATLVRLLVALVCLLSYPLAIVPLGESLEKALDGEPTSPARIWRWESLQFSRSARASHYEERAPLQQPQQPQPQQSQEPQGGGGREAVDGGNHKSSLPMYQKLELGARHRLAVRTTLVLVTAILATVVPCFGVVVSFMGAFSVAILSFVLPPLFHLLLFGARLTRREALSDLVMFAIGLVACVVATSLTARAALGPIIRTHRCPGQ